MRTIVTNGVVITPYQVLENYAVIIENGVVVGVAPSSELQIAACDQVFDAEGKYVAPGFVDIHCHGGGGHDFMDGTVDAFIQAAKTHLRYGTTSILPTTMTSTDVELFRTLDNFYLAQEQMTDGPDLLGVHLEGPYFSLEQRGAQDPRYIKNPTPEEYERVMACSEAIKRWTIAPELPGAYEMGRFLRDKGVVCSIGHSNAVFEDVLLAVENGFSHVTHLYSGMSMVRRIKAYRYAGVVESALLLDDLTVEVIADGVHLPQSLLQLVYKVKGSCRICLVTDSMRAAGMPEGQSILGSLQDGQEVIVEDGVAKTLDRSGFAGSVATTDRLVRTMVEIAGIPLAEAVRMMTLTPARILGIEARKGSLTPGKDGDVVVFDERINISLVFVKGVPVFVAERTKGGRLK